MATRLKGYRLDITEDPEKAIEDPGLAALVAEGWSVAYAWIMNIGDDSGQRTYLMVMLAPPADPSALLPRVEDVERKLMATRKQATAAILASLTIVAMSAAVTVWAVFW